MYSYGIVCCTYSTVSRRVCSILCVPNTLFYPLYCMYNTLYRNCTHKRLPEDEPSGSKHVEDIKK